MAMGIKCSLFGHAYGETTVERDREEQGSEVVITITEIETCRRCGETRVVSENKEVTTIETPEAVEADPPGRGDTDGPGEPASDASVGAEIVDAEAGEPVSTTGSDDVATGEVGTGSEPVEAGVGTDEEAPSAAEDDGVILDSDDEPDREAGEWPEDADREGGYTPEAADGIERFTEAEASEEPDSQVEEPPDAQQSAEEQSVEAADPADESEVWTEADPDLEADRPGGAVTVPDGQFRCPECGFTTPVASSSLREGDFCPECHRGTLLHESG